MTLRQLQDMLDKAVKHNEEVGRDDWNNAEVYFEINRNGRAKDHYIPMQYSACYTPKIALLSGYEDDLIKARPTEF